MRARGSRLDCLVFMRLSMALGARFEAPRVARRARLWAAASRLRSASGFVASSHPGSSAAVAASHQMSEFAFDFGPGLR